MVPRNGIRTYIVFTQKSIQIMERELPPSEHVAGLIGDPFGSQSQEEAVKPGLPHPHTGQFTTAKKLKDEEDKKKDKKNIFDEITVSKGDNGFATDFSLPTPPDAKPVTLSQWLDSNLVKCALCHQPMSPERWPTTGRCGHSCCVECFKEKYSTGAYSIAFMPPCPFPRCGKNFAFERDKVTKKPLRDGKLVEALHKLANIRRKFKEEMDKMVSRHKRLVARLEEENRELQGPRSLSDELNMTIRWEKYEEHAQEQRQYIERLEGEKVAIVNAGKKRMNELVSKSKQDDATIKQLQFQISDLISKRSDLNNGSGTGVNSSGTGVNPEDKSMQEPKQTTQEPKRRRLSLEP